MSDRTFTVDELDQLAEWASAQVWEEAGEFTEAGAELARREIPALSLGTVRIVLEVAIEMGLVHRAAQE